MPEPSANPTPPPSGVYGLPLKKYGQEMRENLPDGGYILWGQQKDAQGKQDWRPLKYRPPQKGISI